MRTPVRIAACCFLACPAARAADADPTAAAVAAAEEAYNREAAAVRTAIGEHLDRREAAARKSGDKDWVDLVRADRSAFAADGRLPAATPRAVVLRADDARAEFAAALDLAVRRYTAARRDDLAAKVQRRAKEFARLTPPVDRQDYPLVPAAEGGGVTWRFTTRRPPRGWETASFDDAGWDLGTAPFGTLRTAITRWADRDIWARRVFELPADKLTSVAVRANHDDGGTVFLNGRPAAHLKGWTRDRYRLYPVDPVAARTLRPGPNTLAVYCTNGGGAQYLDVGLVDQVPAKGRRP